MSRKRCKIGGKLVITVAWIKMKLGVQVGLGPGHIVLDGDPANSVAFATHRVKVVQYRPIPELSATEM